MQSIRHLGIFFTVNIVDKILSTAHPYSVANFRVPRAIPSIWNFQVLLY